MRRASLVPFAFLALASLAGEAILMPRAAEACSYAAAEPAAVQPVAGETGVPTNAQLWLTGSAVTEVRLTAGVSSVPVEVAAFKVYPVHLDRLYRVKPAALLSPGTRYTVTIKSSFHPDVSFSFTSGAGELLTAPGAPATLGAGARQIQAGNSCYDGLPFLVKVSAPVVTEAALYELQASTDSGEHFASLGFSATPSIEFPAAARPSPVYRLRPLAVTGLGADEETLPTAEVPADEMPLDRIGEPAPPGPPAAPPEPPKKSSGCSASGAGGSSSALWLASAVLGWSLWKRRRRRGARSLAVLGAELSEAAMNLLRASASRASRFVFTFSMIAFALAVTAAPRRAEACDPVVPRIRAWHPVADQADVPTNTLLWISGAVGAMTLKAGTQPVAATQMPVAAHVQAVQVRPSQPLSPNTRYTVSATGPHDEQAVTFSFTTGDGAELTPAAATTAIRVTARRALATDGGFCVSRPAGYNLTIEADPVAGAVLYELLEVGDEGEGGYELLVTAEEPQFFVFTQTLPSPKFAIRPVALNGLSASAEILPTGHAPDEDGGCSAAGTPSSMVAWLMAALAGGGLRRRRRRN